MILNRFRLKLFLLAILISLSGAWSIHLLLTEHLWITRIGFLIIWFLATLYLVHYVTRTNRMLNSFLDSIKYLDGIPDSNTTDQSFKDLNLSLNTIIRTIKDATREKEVHSNYLTAIIEYVNTGFISYDSRGNVRMFNRAAKELLELPVLRSLDELGKLKSGLPEVLKNLDPGSAHLSQLIINQDLHQVLFRKTIIKLPGEQFYIVTLQDIRSELEEEELDTWKKLIQILRHEIMNSVSPLNSLSLSLSRIIDKIKADIPEKEAGMLMEGLEAISRRSQGLMKFVQTYRELTSIPRPEFREFPVKEMVDQSLVLFADSFRQKNIRVETKIQQDLMLTADFNLVSQVFINLVKNSFEAIENPEGKIIIEAFKNNKNRVLLQVRDTGKGISPGEIEQVFFPFYTTKEEGSGIGLSLARQIMRMHKGQVNIRSTAGKGTTVILIF